MGVVAHVTCGDVKGRAERPLLRLAGHERFYLHSKLLPSVEMLEAVLHQTLELGWTGLKQGEISLDYGPVYIREKSVEIMDLPTTGRNQSRLWTGNQSRLWTGQQQ